MIPKTNCLKCNALLWDDNPIQPVKKGDYVLCIYCGNPAVFDKNLKLKTPKKIPIDIYLKSIAIKQAISNGLNMDQIIKDELIKCGHIKEH